MITSFSSCYKQLKKKNESSVDWEKGKGERGREKGEGIKIHTLPVTLLPLLYECMEMLLSFASAFFFLYFRTITYAVA